MARLLKGLSKMGAAVGVVEVEEEEEGLEEEERAELLECDWEGGASTRWGRMEPRRDSAGEEEAEEAGRRGSPVVSKTESQLS